MSLLIDFCMDYRTYLSWQVSSILSSIIISSFDFNLFKQSLILEAKTTSTSPATMCPAFVWHNCTVYLLDLICPSVSKIFQSIFKLLDHTCRLTCIPIVKKFSLWSNCTKYKRKVLWATTKLKDKAIWNSYLMYMYFKTPVTLQMKSQVSKQTSDYLSLTQPEFQCVYTK